MLRRKPWCASAPPRAPPPPPPPPPPAPPPPRAPAAPRAPPPRSRVWSPPSPPGSPRLAPPPSPPLPPCAVGTSPPPLGAYVPPVIPARGGFCPASCPPPRSPQGRVGGRGQVPAWRPAAPVQGRQAADVRRGGRAARPPGGGGGVGEVRGERAWLEAAASSPSTPWAGAGDAGVAPFAVFIVSRSRPSGAG